MLWITRGVTDVDPFEELCRMVGDHTKNIHELRTKIDALYLDNARIDRRLARLVNTPQTISQQNVSQLTDTVRDLKRRLYELEEKLAPEEEEEESYEPTALDLVTDLLLRRRFLTLDDVWSQLVVVKSLLENEERRATP
jgi:predicted  nucleic acid-binding Zn-ribbon protein